MKKRTTKEIVEILEEIFKGCGYDFSEADYLGNKSPMRIFCPVEHHGWFESTPRNLIERKCGCPICGGYTLNTEVFKARGKLIHKDKFDYTKSDYINGKTKVIIGCPTHGDFLMEPNNHINGMQGCKQCAHDSFRKNYRKDSDQFFEECDKKHNSFYTYLKDDYINNKNEIEITCPIHGVFWQTAQNHLVGRGCYECGKIKLSQLRSQTPEEIILRCQEVHGDRYGYIKSLPTGMLNHMEIECVKHGPFFQTPAHHIYDASGCPSCSKTESKWELEVKDYLTSLGVELRKDRTLINPFEIDIYVPDKKVAFELNGLFFHSEIGGNKVPSYHRNKTVKCKAKDVDLYHFFDDEWKDNKPIVKSMMKAKLGIITNKIFARKCKVKEVGTEEGLKFLDENHIQGSVGSSIKLGLYYEDEWVSMMSFNKHKDYDWDLNRFCNMIDHCVVGAASKIFKYFIDRYDPNTIVSYADLRWSRGDIYNTLGFADITDAIRISYYYTKDHVTKHHKRGFRHEYLADKLTNYDPDLSEWENMKNNGYDRIWDCGKLKYLWTKKA